MQARKRPAVVLLAEDNPAEQHLAQRAFKEASVQCELRIVSDGEEAMQYLQRQGRYADPGASPEPDFMLLDLNMPRVDGRQVLERIKNDPELRTLPVVVLTTSNAERDIITSYQLGCSSFVQKPFDIYEFSSTLAGLVNYWLHLVTLPPKH